MESIQPSYKPLTKRQKMAMEIASSLFAMTGSIGTLSVSPIAVHLYQQFIPQAEVWRR